MDRSAVIYLIGEAYSQNDYGVLKSETRKRKIFAQVSSVTGTEWFEGGRNGLNPELRFRVKKSEYREEKIIEYDGKRYGIYRTYTARNDELDLYTERKEGNVKAD